MITMGIDLGQVTGINTMNGTQILFEDFYKLQGDSNVKRARVLWEKLNFTLAMVTRPSVIFIEEPPLCKDPHVYKGLCIYEYIVQKFAEENKIRYYSLENRSAKAWFVGKGNAKKRTVFDRIASLYVYPSWDDYEARDPKMSIGNRDNEINVRDSIMINLYGQHLIKEGLR